MNQNRKDRMKGNFSFGKRLLSTALAAAMAATSMGTQAFAQPEATEESAEVQPSRVISWSWPEEAELDWVEEDQAWLFSCVYSEDQPLTEETLTQLLPSQITAVVQTPSVSQPENSSEMADSEATEEAVAVEENAAVFDSIATPDTSASDGGGAVSASAEELGAGFSEELGESASGTVDAVSQTLSLDLTWDFSGLSFPVQPGQYNLQASLPEGYLLETNASPLSLTLAVMPDNDLASDSGLCVHHPQHTTECGYAEGKSLCKFAQNGCPYCVVSWKWIDPDELLAEENGTWIMGMPGVNQDNPMTRDALGQMLPTQITATTQDGQNVTLALVWDLTALPEEGAVSGTYTVVAQLAETNENYALTEEASPLEVTLQLGGGETYSGELTLPSGTPPYSEHIVNGVSPNGTTIDLFDYWLTEQTTSDASDPEWLINRGINHEESDQEGTVDNTNNNAQDGHALIFVKEKGDNKGEWNKWTGNKNPTKGIVANELENGYPKLNLDTSTVSDANMHRDGKESLAYLFDPNYEHPGKASYKDVQGLLQVDDEGYYYYNSQKNYATYYADTNSFTLYEYPGVIPGGRSPVGQFFPFNAANADAESHTVNDQTYRLMNTSKSNDTSINHYFGMHMSTRFIQQYGGYTDGTYKTPVTYDFAGDDDVWIFIDGKLVADLGGIHDMASVNIDFVTGTITINGESQSKSLGQLLGYEDNTLPNNTYHTLDFFYLERGNTDSNMYLKYNLVTIPESDLIKIDQLGDPVPGAVFTLYAADDTNRDTPIATGTTDNKGEFVFLDNTGMPITIDKLYNQYGTIGNQTESDLVLVETYTPPGYRSGGEIGLYFSKAAGGEVLLRSNSVWTEGAYAMPKVTATTPNVIRSADNPSDTVTLIGNDKVENPIMFAVVFQKQGKDADGNYIWRPVSGDPLNGWKIWEDSTWDSVIGAAKASPYVFQVATSGAYQVEISNMPGDIAKYYYVCKDIEKAQYTIGYYYSSADTWTRVSVDNTWRIDSDPTETGDEQYALDRVFSMDLYVTNIKNRLLVQKVDDKGVAVNGAKFSLYKADDVTIDGGTVTVNPEATPYDSLTTAPVSSILTLDGGGVFPTDGKVLELGEYYLIETSAPTGYKLNDTAVHVIVDNTGVYADAGAADDGVTVLRGVGSVMRSMIQFAVNDGVDTTLQGIKAALATSVEYNGSYHKDGSFTVDGSGIKWDSTLPKDVLHLQYANANAMLDYGLYDGTGGSIDDLTFATEVGWSKVLIQQCYQHDNSVNTTLKTNLGDMDITNLFSGSVTVRVANDRTGNLKISKTVTGDNAPSGKEFTFRVTVKEAGKSITGTYQTSGSQPAEVAFDANGTATVTLQAGENLTILGLPADATYTVTETVIPPGFAASVTVTGDDSAQVSGATVTGTIPHNTTADGCAELAYTNDFDGKARLAIAGQKTIQGGAIAIGDSFAFTLTAADEPTQTAITSGKVVLPNPATVEVNGDGATETTSFSFGEITFKAEGTYKFNVTENVPSGVTESAPVSNGVWYDTHTAVVTVTVKTDSNGILYVDNTTYTNAAAPSKSDQDITDKAAFTNAYQSLTISKTVTGNMGDKTKPFTFTLTLTKDGNPVSGTFPAEGVGGTVTFENNGTATLSLTHGQSITIDNLPVGAVCTVTETAAAGYDTTVATTAGQVTIDNDNRKATATITADATATVNFTNNCTIQPPTGLHGETRPYKAMVGLAGAAAVIGIAGWVQMRRRKRREQE